MNAICADSLQESFHDIMTLIDHDGKEVIVRNLKTKELHPCFIEISNPQKRHLLYPKRGNNPFASLAETMWVLAGRNDMEWLEKFLPRCKDYSDDGSTWRAGYGPRIRNWHGVRFNKDGVGINESDGSEAMCDKAIYGVDQIKFVIEMLKKDPNSRQAIISIWDPELECTVEKTKDYPCNNWLHFMIRDRALDLTVSVRSNDAVFGYSGINVYEWTVLQEIIAKELGVNVGKYYHLSDSMHVYETHFEKMKELINSHIELPELPYFGFFDTNNFNPESNYVEYFKQVEELCENVYHNNNGDFAYDFCDLDLVDRLLRFYLTKNLDLWRLIMENMPLSDLKVACLYWYEKNMVPKDQRHEDGMGLVYWCIEKCTI